MTRIVRCRPYARCRWRPTARRPDRARRGVTFAHFCRAVRGSAEIDVFDRRDPTFDDLVEANVLAADSDNGVVAVARGTATMVNDLLELQAEISGVQPRIDRRARVPRDVLRTDGRTGAVQSATDCAAAIGLREGLEKQHRWIAAVPAWLMWEER